MLNIKDNPWLGLSSYENQDSYRFYGRDNDITELENAISDNLFTIIYGITGAGKTSLINAGLSPRLADKNYLPIRLRLDHSSTIGYNTQIILALQTAITVIHGEIERCNALQDDEIVENESLWNFLFTSKFWSKTNHQLIPVLFIDQFEEIFTKNEDADKIVEFFETINSLQYNKPPKNTLAIIEEKQEGYIYYNDKANFRLVLSLREDFLARLEDYSYNIPALRKNRKGIKRMNGYQALDVILKPLPDIITREVALLILEKVTGTIVEDKEKCLNRLSVDTSILSLFCSELYQKAANRNVEIITKELVEEFGNNIITSFYDETMKTVSAKSVEYLETHLLTHSGFRNSMAKEDLLQNGIKETELEYLASKRLVRIETFDNVERVEFTHDVLCGVANQHRELRLSKKGNKIDNILNLTFIIETCLATLCLIIVFIGQYKFSNGYSFHISLFGQFLPMLILCTLIYIIHKSHKIKGNYRKKIQNLLICILLIGSYTFFNDVFSRHGLSILNIENNRYIIEIGILIGTLGIFFKEKEKSLVVKQFMKYSTYILILLLLIYEYKIILLTFFFYVIYILLPSCFSKDKRLSFFLIPISFIFPLLMVFLLVDGMYGFESDLLGVILFIFIVLIFCKGIWNVYTFNERTDISIKALPFYGFQNIISSPWKRNLILTQFIILAVVISFIIGWGLSDYYTLIATPLLSVFCFILGHFIVNNLVWRRKEGEKTLIIPYFKLLYTTILSMIMVVAILAAQYLHYHTYIQLTIWVISIVLFILFLKQYTYKRKGTLIISLLWIFSYFAIPILGMGYNPFVLSEYTRVYGGRICYRPITRFITIKDAEGNIGLRDRDNLIIPVENKYIELAKFKCAYYGEGLPFIYNIEKEDLHVYDYIDYLNSENLADIEFMVITNENKKHLWKCSEHLEDNNVCSILLKGEYKKCIENATGRFWNTDYLVKYLTYVNISPSCERDNILKKVFFYALYEKVNALPDTIKKKIEFSNFGEIRKCVQNIPSSTFAKCIDGTYGFYQYYYDNKIPISIVDTLYSKCAKDTLDQTDARTKAKWYIESKAYNKAIQYAKISIKENNSIHNYAHIILARASYLNGNYEIANNLIYVSGDETCYLNPPYYFVRGGYALSENELYNAIDTIKGDNPYVQQIIIGDAIYSLIQKDIYRGILKDTISTEFNILMNSLKKYSRRTPYDFVEKRLIGGRMYYLSKTYDKRGRVLKYIMDKEKQITPRFGRFDGDIIWGYSPKRFEDDIFMNVICEDGKRRYIKYSASKDSVYLLPNSYDHIWRFSEGYAVVMINEKMGIIDEEGQYILKPQFQANIKMPAIYSRTDEMNDKNWMNWEDNIISSDNPYFKFTNGTCPMFNQNTCKYGRINIKGEWVQQ